MSYPQIKINCGCNHTSIIRNNQIYIFGRGEFGRLGLGDTLNQLSPQKLVLPEKLDVVDISSGCHTVALTSNGKVYVWGHNFYGQLGLGHNRSESTPLPLTFLSENFNIKLISCGGYHTVALVGLKHDISTSHILYVWGRNDHGQLGLNDNFNKNFPQKLVFDDKIRSVCCGGFHTTAITVFNQMYIWGANYYGQLGLGDWDSKYIPQKLNLSDVISISCGAYHTIALIKTLNKIWMLVWGHNNVGQLGLGHNAEVNSPHELILENIISVSCGGFHTLALTSDGELYGWGENFKGQLGLGNFAGQSLPVKINLNGIIKMSCGDDHTIVIDQYGSVYVWGYNGYGNLGLGDIENRNVPIKFTF